MVLNSDPAICAWSEKPDRAGASGVAGDRLGGRCNVKIRHVRRMDIDIHT